VPLRFDTFFDPFASERLDQPPSRLIAFFRHYVGQVWPMFLGVIVVGGALAATNAAVYAYIGVVIDRLNATDGAAAFLDQNTGLLLAVAALVLLVEPILVLCHVILVQGSLVPSFNTLIRWQTHRYLLRQSLGFFQNDFAGRLSQKIMQTSLALRRSMVSLVDAVWFALFFLVTAIAILLELDWRAALPVLVWTVLYIATLCFAVPRIQKASAAASEAHSSLSGRIVDSYTNIQTVKLFGHARLEDAYSRAGMAEQTERSLRLTLLLGKLDIALSTLSSVLIVGHGIAVLALWGLDALTIGGVVTSVGLVVRITQMSHWMMFVASEISENVGIVRDGADVISQPQAITDRPGAPALRVPHGEIRFERVSFHYGPDAADRPAIPDLTLRIRPGEKVGLVGPSGAGKSTLVNLMLRFHDVQAGRILIDEQDIAAVAQESLRAQIGMVTQDTSLLHRSVLDNIRYGQPDATPEQVERAARLAHAHDFIRGLRDGKGRTGYHAHVGERGVTLSGGQRQRIAIARVLLKDAPILILDEATSALDSGVEAAIQERLTELMAGKTVVAVAHRLSTIAAMDRLLVLEGGRVVESGSHAELLARSGLYADLWARQSAGFVAESRTANNPGRTDAA